MQPSVSGHPSLPRRFACLTRCGPGLLLGLGLGLGGCAAPPDNHVALQEIHRLQDQRTGDIGPLLAYLRHGDPTVRRRAVTALGALRRHNTVDGLSRAVADMDRSVQLEAVFALGQQPGNDRWRRLEDLARPSDPELCAAVLNSLRPDDRSAKAHLNRLVLAADATVVGAAALALVRLHGDRLRNPKLQLDPDQLRRLRDLLATALSRQHHAQARWQLVYALAHLSPPGADQIFITIAANHSEGRYARLFAIRGLGAAPLVTMDQRGRRTNALLALSRGTDAMLCLEAVQALGQTRGQRAPQPVYDEESVVDELLRRRFHGSIQVRVAATRALASFQRHGGRIIHTLTANPGQDLPCRAAELQTLTTLGGDEALAQLRQAATATDWRLRAAAAKSLRQLPWASAQQLAQDLTTDADVRVQVAAFESLAQFRGQWRAVQIAIAGLNQRDLATRETLSTTLSKLGDPRAIPALVRAYHDSPGLLLAEPRKLTLRAVTSLDAATPATLKLLRLATDDPVELVRRQALRLLRRLQLPAKDLRAGTGTRNGLITPLLGRHIPFDFVDSRPVLQIVTRHGKIEITLRPDKAPVHCFNLLQLIREGKYQGRLFHRVAPNFVVQGGDNRVDGFGATAYHGGRLRDELSDLPFGAGVIGMPKTEDPDTGGDQIFITSVPTPHLNRRYTVLGTITRGMNVLEHIEIGDVMQNVSVLRH